MPDKRGGNSVVECRAELNALGTEMNVAARAVQICKELEMKGEIQEHKKKLLQVLHRLIVAQDDLSEALKVRARIEAEMDYEFRQPE